MGTQPATSADLDTTSSRATAAPPPLTGVNRSIIIGALVTEPEWRTLPGGTVSLHFSLTVRRPDQATTSVPLAWYDPPKRPAAWKLGVHVVAIGQVVRRFYQAGGRTASRTEVSVERAEVLTRRAGVERIVATYRSALDDQLEEALLNVRPTR